MSQEHSGIFPVHPARDVVTCGPDATIQEAAALMSRGAVGSIVVIDAQRRPLGIVTDTDLRTKVVAGKRPVESQIRSIMSSPVVTVPLQSSGTATIITMMRRGIRHLCITADGTPASAVIGIVSEHDVVLLQGNNPAVIAKEISQAVDLTRLASLRGRGEDLVREYVRRGLSVRFVADLVAEINDALVARLLALAENSLQAAGWRRPSSRYCWLALGSDGRREQLLRTDQDTALVYEDPPEGEEDTAEKYFRMLAADVTAGLTACGFAPCPGGNMASNPEWCKPLSAWREYFRAWLRVPKEEALLHAATFFDFRPVCGVSSLAQTLRECITQELDGNRTALILMAKNAVHNPPATGLWRRLVVEKKGPYRDFFDLKLRAMKPVTDAARVLTLDRGMHGTTGTIARIERIAEDDRSVAGLSRDVVEAYERFMQYRILYGSGGTDRGSGRYLDLTKLSTQEARQLRSVLGSVPALLRLVAVRYQLDALGLR
jgi:CBS domain-containing protein